MKNIGEKVKEFRLARGWNTTQMAKHVRTSRQNIENLEAKGDMVPRYVAKLAVALGPGVTVDSLIAPHAASTPITIPVNIEDRRAPQGQPIKEMPMAARRRQIAEDVVTLLEDIDNKQDLLMAWNAVANAIEHYKKEMEKRSRRPRVRSTKTHPESKQPAETPTIHTPSHR
jgi:transcriptional regulator with XRE-family HTH domain